MFVSRKEAGKQIQRTICPELSLPLDIIVAIPRGGVEIAHPIALQQKKPIDLIFPRKLRTPQNPEYAFGAIMDKDTYYLNHETIERLSITQSYIKSEIQHQLLEIDRRKKQFQTQHQNFNNQSILLVDDGIATGYTMLAAANYLSKYTDNLVIAVPVASQHAYLKLKDICRIEALIIDENLTSVGAYYQSFPQTEDSEVIKLLNDIKD